MWEGDNYSNGRREKKSEHITNNLPCMGSAWTPGVMMKKIVYTDPMTVPNQLIFVPGDGMCDNYLKREKKITG